MLSPAFWWALAGVVLMLCEFAAPGLILFFFGMGALFTALLTWLLPLSIEWQLGIFAAASLISLFALRRFLKPIFTGGTSAASDDAFTESLAGTEGTVTEPIAPGKAGKVRLHGTDWTAEADEELDVGRTVVVLGQRSLTLSVKGK